MGRLKHLPQHKIQTGSYLPQPHPVSISLAPQLVCLEGKLSGGLTVLGISPTRNPARGRVWWSTYIVATFPIKELPEILLCILMVP